MARSPQSEAAGAIVRGMTRQVGNEIDEFKTEALRNNLLGLPLDLAAINLARGRDTGVPSLNAARNEFYNMTKDTPAHPLHELGRLRGTPEARSVSDQFHCGLWHPPIHSQCARRWRTSAPQRRHRHWRWSGTARPPGLPERPCGDHRRGRYRPVDRRAGREADAVRRSTRLDLQLLCSKPSSRSQQNGDRFYYLERTGGLNFLTELEGNLFAKLVMANTDATHLPGAIFTTPTSTSRSIRPRAIQRRVGQQRPDRRQHPQSTGYP